MPDTRVARPCASGSWRRSTALRIDAQSRAVRSLERDVGQVGVDHWRISSIRSINDCGMVRPSSFAVLRLRTVSYLIGVYTGRSAGLAPRQDAVDVGGGASTASSGPLQREVRRHRSSFLVHQRAYCMSSSARASSVDGIVSPRVVAVFRLMIIFSFTACSTGRYAGFAPPTVLSP